MNTHFLFPHSFKKMGWTVFSISFILAIIYLASGEYSPNFLETKVFAVYNDDHLFYDEHFFQVIKNNITNELLVLGLIIGGVLIGFSKTKNEDEMIAKIRYESLVWAVYVNYGLVVLFTVFVYGTWFLNVMMYNTFTLLLFFIIRFHYMIYKLNPVENEE